MGIFITVLNCVCIFPNPEAPFLVWWGWVKSAKFHNLQIFINISIYRKFRETNCIFGKSKNNSFRFRHWKKNPSNYATSQFQFENYYLFHSYSRYQNSPIRVSFLLPDNNDKFHFVATIFLQLGFIVIQFFFTVNTKKIIMYPKYIYIFNNGLFKRKGWRFDLCGPKLFWLRV